MTAKLYIRAFRLISILILALLPLRAHSAEMAHGVVYHDTNENGLRDAREKGVRGVLVSNGCDITQTNRRGEYALTVEPDNCIFVIKPAGWRTEIDENGLSRFFYIYKPDGSPKLNDAGTPPTGPLPESIDFPLYRQHEPEVFKVVLMADPQVSSQIEVNYFKHDIIGELVGTDAAFAVGLGDLVNNNLSLMAPLNEAMGQIGIPWYAVKGNHDTNLDALNDPDSDETYESVYGPTYYSFNYGKAHFINLDSVQWHGEPHRYHGEIGERQLEFIKNDLKYVPKDHLIVLLTHIPSREFIDLRQLFGLLSDYPHTVTLAGHWHHQANLLLGKDMGWSQEKPHQLFIVGTACGAWWRGQKDELGLPHAVMLDGTPNGYAVLSIDDSDYSIRYKAARRPEDYQMNITVRDDKCVVNIFAGSERAKVECRFDRTGPWQPMVQSPGFAPTYEALCECDSTLQAPVFTYHLWSLPLPEHPVKLIEVRATDLFGQTHFGAHLMD